MWRQQLESQNREESDAPKDTLTFDRLCRILNHALTATPGEPQAFALMPLELYGVMHQIDGDMNGIIHVDRHRREVAALTDRVDIGLLAECFAANYKLRTMLCITALFERSAMLFGEKGYRFAVAESGRMAQNILLSANAEHVPATLETQYYDRSIEAVLGIDGVEHAVLQVISLG
jgi:hypothetical protein